MLTTYDAALAGFPPVRALYYGEADLRPSRKTVRIGGVKKVEQKYLYQVLPFLNELNDEKRRQLEDYFHTAPVWLMDSFKIEEMDRGQIFVRENAPVETVYVVARGIIKATDYRVYGVAYDFMHFEGTYAMGGMEVVMDLDYYRTTLETVTPCTMITIPKQQFKKWLDTDIKALKQESKAITGYLVTEARQGRAFLFLQGVERLKMLLTQKYEAYNRNGVYETSSTRTELAEESGLCVKTINRSVKRLEEEKLIGRRGNRITISRQQYEQMKDSVSRILDI